MKNFFVLSVFIILSIIVNGQITIKSSDFAPKESVFTQTTDTNNYPIDVGGTGQQTWDFSNLSTGDIDTLFIVSANNSPNISDFPKSNYVVKVIDKDTSTIYQYINTEDSLLSYGMTFSNTKKDSAIQRDLPFEFLSLLPITYSPSDVHIISYIETTEIKYSNNQGIYQKISHKTDTAVVDAYGILNLPNFQGLNTLRISVRSSSIDTVFYINQTNDDSIVSHSKSLYQNYFWFTNDSRLKFQALQIKIDSQDTSITFIKHASIATN